jgi:RHS repeat-associated protein
LLPSIDYRWEVNDMLAALIDSARGPVRFGYDARARLVAAHHSTGRVEHRALDAVGNVYRDPTHRDRVYGVGGELLQSEGARYQYDSDGNLCERIDRDGSRWTYAWNAAGQLCQVTRPDGRRVKFSYDAMGRRVKKVCEGRETSWLWDGDTTLHELSPTEGPITWMFEPDTLAPLGQIQGGQCYGIVSDHLGTPLAMFDEVGAIAWKAQLDVVGLAETDVARTPCPWRWPGQYEDVETGLYYNRFRYYDPTDGKYISQDPIRIDGGMNLYGHLTDPNTHFDPFGLAPWTFNPAVDLDWQGGGHTFQDAIAEAFRRTGVPRDQFTVTQWATSIYGKSVPVEWQAPGGAIVNVDNPRIVPTGEGPQVPHVGYQTPGKRKAGTGRVRGHILLDDVPATRPSLQEKKLGHC